MIDAVTERSNGHRAAGALKELTPDTEPQDATPDTQPAVSATAPPPRTRRRQALTYDQFLLLQVPLFITLALVFGCIAYAVSTQRPIGEAATNAGVEAVAGSGAGGDAPITAFAGGAATQQVLVAADPTGALKWDRAIYEAQAGDVTFVVANKSSSSHNFAVEGPNVTAQGPNFGANTTTTYTLRGLKPGEYQIICNFPGHRTGGMVSKLVVK